MVQRLVLLAILAFHAASFQQRISAIKPTIPTRKGTISSLQVVIPDKPPIEAATRDKKSSLHKLWSTGLGKAVTSSELKTIAKETAYEVNRTTSSIWEKAKGIGELILSPKKDVALEKQLDDALGRENKSDGWLEGSVTYILVFLLFSVIFQAIAKSS